MKSQIILIFFSLSLCACANIYEALSNKTSDEALYEDVQNLMDQQDWDTALEKFADMSDEFKTRPEVIQDWAGVLAGKCGLNFIEYFNSLSSVDLTGSTIFKYLMNVFTGKVVSADHCRQAQLKLEEISVNPANRTAGQNLFMAILGMVKVGTYLRTYADRNGTDNLGDGTAEISVCTNDAANLPQAALDEVITGFGLITDNIAYVTAAVSGSSSLLTDLDSVCASPATSAICGKTSVSEITNSDRNAYIDFLATSTTNPTVQLGVGACNNLDPTTCCGNTYP